MLIVPLLLLIFITQALAKVHHQCGLNVRRTIFTYNGMKKTPGVDVFFHRMTRDSEAVLNLDIDEQHKFPLLIYKEEDRHLTNIPHDFDKEDSWGSFGLCSEDDIKSKVCSKLNSFKIKYENEDVPNRIYNDIYVSNGNNDVPPHLDHENSIKLESFGKYCYVYYLTEEQEPDEKMGVFISVYIGAFNQLDIVSHRLTTYYGRAIQLSVNICLLLFIWFKKSNNIIESIKKDNIQYHTPFIYCFIMLIVSSVTSIIHLFLINIDIKSHFIPYEQHSFLQRNNWSVVEYLVFFESIFSLVLYICAFQFANLDKFGYKINYRKNKFTKLLPLFMLFAFLIHYFVLDYSYSLVDFIFRERTAPSIVYPIMHHSSKFIEFLSFGAIWYTIYKISQEASKEISNIKEYANRFNKTRIWIVFAMILMGIIKIIFEDLLYTLVSKITTSIESAFGYEETAGLLTKIVLFNLKFVLCFLREFMLFALPVLSIIIIKIWWSYNPKLDEGTSIELTRV